MKIKDLLSDGQPKLSFEVFPPKTEGAYFSVAAAAAEIARLRPSFMSVTYGAGGGTSQYTLDIAKSIKDRHGVPTLAHLTCVSSTREAIAQKMQLFFMRQLYHIDAVVVSSKYAPAPPMGAPRLLCARVRHISIVAIPHIRFHMTIAFCANARPRTLGTLPDDASRLMRGVPTQRLVGLRPPPCVVPPRKPIGFRQRTETRKPAFAGHESSRNQS